MEMTSQVQEASGEIIARMGRRFSKRMEDLDRRASEEKSSAQRRHQEVGRALGLYLAHLSSVYERVVAENHPFTRANLLDMYAPGAILELIHDSILYLNSELVDKKTGILGIYSSFRVGDLGKIKDLRSNSPRDLSKLIGSDTEMGEQGVFDAVSLGFVEVCPAELRREQEWVETQKAYHRSYGGFILFGKVIDLRKHARALWDINPQRQLEMNYILTPIGRAAVLPIGEYPALLAQKERVFEEDRLIEF